MIENLKCCLAHPMTALRTLKEKINEVITGHNELVAKVNNLPTDGGGSTGSGSTGGGNENPTPPATNEGAVQDRLVMLYGMADMSGMEIIEGGYKFPVIPMLEDLALEEVLENIHERDLSFDLFMDESMVTFFRLPFLYMDEEKLQFGVTIAGQSSYLLTAYESSIVVEMKQA